ncbi:uncharacterized protein LOC141884733 isoform X2 [Acropora palmata]|uniref:uncharacterized protein LOC141884733 isoform X2 n=1 Tax=Acropora palmata TaxID=6131 RepID=UPI003D9FD54D
MEGHQTVALVDVVMITQYLQFTALSYDVKKKCFLLFHSAMFTPFQARRTLDRSRDLGTPNLSRGNTVAYWRKSNHFSLLNPSLERPCTVKIASPNTSINRTFNLSNSPLKGKTPEKTNPCSRASVMSALKESRKRTRFAVDDEEEDLEVGLRPSKRRSCKPINVEESNVTHGLSQVLSRPFFGCLKRVGRHESNEISTEEITNKRSKLEEDGEVLPESGRYHTQTEYSHNAQKRKGTDEKSVNARDASIEDSEESISKKVKRFSSSGDVNDNSQATAVREHDTTMVTDSAGHKLPETDQSEDQGRNDSKHMESSVTNYSSSKCVDDKSSEESQRNNADEGESVDSEDKSNNSEANSITDSGASNKRKRFTIPRFLSKADPRRRALPVYCASNEESEMPQRRHVTRKINQEQIKMDRKLAWERVKRFLDNDDDDDDEEEEKEDEMAKTSGSAVVSADAKAISAPSLFKIPVVPAPTSIGTVTTTTQSIVAPVLATGHPQQTTGVQVGSISTVVQSSSTVSGSTERTQFQALAGSSMQLQQTVGSGVLSALSSNQLASCNAPTAATTKQESSTVLTSLSGPVNQSNTSLSGFQAKTVLTSTTSTTGQGKDGFHFSSPFLTGDSLPTKPAKTDQITLLSGSVQNDTRPRGVQFSSSFRQSATNSFVPASQNSMQRFVTPVSNSPNIAIGQVAAEMGQNFAKSSLNPEAFKASTSSLTQSPFKSLVKTTQSEFPSSSASVLGQIGNTTQGVFGTTALNKGGFGTPNMLSVPKASQPSQVATGSTFEGSLMKTASQSPFNQNASGTESKQDDAGPPMLRRLFGEQQIQQSSFGLNTAKCRITFGSHGTQNSAKNNNSAFTVGSQLQNQNATSSTLGTHATKNAFETQSKQPVTQNTFGTQTSQNAFGSQQPSHGTFGNKVSQNTFLQQQQPNQSAFGAALTSQNAFGSQQATRSAFGTQASFGAQQPSQSAFGTPQANQVSKSSFSFAVNTASDSSSSPFGSFDNKAGPSSKNTMAPAGGFNFTLPANNSVPASGGFNFNVASGSGSGGFQFDSQATPSRPAQPIGTFNFNPGSSTPGPAFGIPNTTQGANIGSHSKVRPRLIARRRGKK